VSGLLLDTNTISYIARNRSPAARSRLERYQDVGPIFLSAISEGEILYGLAKRPDAHRVAHFMHATLSGLRILPWSSEAATAYGILRARNEALGISIGALDMLIAAHALAAGAVLVTNDTAFTLLAGGPKIENWATDIRPN
jgi:tRNA(fMet)-specific endonuclease VapC